MTSTQQAVAFKRIPIAQGLEMIHNTSPINWIKTMSATTLIAACCGLLADSADMDFADRPNLSLNDIQMIGSHNSYKKAMPDPVMTLLKWADPRTAQGLDYSHIDIGDQLLLGLRVFELDLFYDPTGGRYSRPLGRWLNPLTESFTEEELAQLATPGLKVLHIQDFDYRSHCLTFLECLRIFQIFSDAHPTHLPIFISLNLKTTPIGLPGSTKPLVFDKAGYLRIHHDLKSALGLERIVTPNEVQGDSSSLRARVTRNGFPKLPLLLGRFIFLIDEPAVKTASYLSDFDKDQRLLFLSLPHQHEQAAILVMNDPVAAFAEIKARVSEGFLIRTRADANTVEARASNYIRMRAAFNSGAQFISTDYYLPDPALLNGYQVRFPSGGYVR